MKINMGCVAFAGHPLFIVMQNKSGIQEKMICLERIGK